MFFLWGEGGQTRASCVPCHHGASTRPTLIPNAVFLRWQTLKCLKRLKGHALISCVVIPETKECALHSEEGDNLINMQLCSRLPRGSGNASGGNVRVCARCAEQPFRLWSRHQAPGNPCLPQPPLPFHPSHLSDLCSPALISDICLILTT